MKYLQDTHALIWFLEGDQRLSPKAKTIICNEALEVYVSIASLWEMAIKISLQKLVLSQSLQQLIAILPQQAMTLLPIQPVHVVDLLHLPFEHRDPFDRLLIVQALRENMKLLSNEDLFLKYGVDKIW